MAKFINRSDETMVNQHVKDSISFPLMNRRLLLLAQAKETYDPDLPLVVKFTQTLAKISERLAPLLICLRIKGPLAILKNCSGFQPELVLLLHFV